MVDPKIMAELLDKPDIRGKVKKMNPETLTWYKEMLVSTGIYDKYTKERKVK
jgi:hypothetical protein